MAIEKVILKDRAAWLHHRMGYIGGSEISAVIGCNPYMDNQRLFDLKTGRARPDDISDKDYVQYGIGAENHLRELFKLDFPQYDVFYEENNSFINDKYPWAAASLDGWLIEKETGRRGVLEIKTTNILQSMQKEKWDNRIPQNYYCQVLFYMAVTEADFAILKGQLKTVFGDMPYLQTKHYYMERTAEVQADIDYMMTAGARFWNDVKAGKRPPLLLPEL